MCGRYALSKLEEIQERFKTDVRLMELQRFFNLAPTESAPVIIEEDHKRVLLPMAFGLIPSWSRTGKLEWSTINAKSETAAEKPAFRDPIRYRRCLVLADGYFEWQAEGKAKLPYLFRRRDGAPFAFAGIWDRWKGPDGAEKKTFAILTTTPNGLASPDFIDRMPVILAPENESLWIAPYVTETKTVLPLLKPYPREEMTMVRVSTVVNSARNKGEACVTPLEGT